MRIKALLIPERERRNDSNRFRVTPLKVNKWLLNLAIITGGTAVIIVPDFLSRGFLFYLG